MIRILFMGLLFFASQAAFTQEIQIKWTAEKTHATPECFDKLVKVDTGSFTVLNKIIISEDAYGTVTRLNPVIKEYSSEFELIKEFDFNKIFKSKCTLINLDNKLYCLSEQRDYEQKQNQLVAQQINAIDFSLNPEKTLLSAIPYTSRSFPGEHLVISSADNSKFAVLDTYPYKTNPFTFQVSVFGPGFQLLYKTLIEVNGDTNCAIQTAKLSENGQVFILVKQGKTAYRIYRTEAKKGTVRQLTLDNPKADQNPLNLMLANDKAWLLASTNTADGNEARLLFQALSFKRKSGSLNESLFAKSEKEPLKMAASKSPIKNESLFSAFETEQGIVAFFADNPSDSSQNLMVQIFDKKTGRLRECFVIETVDLGLAMYLSKFAALDARRFLLVARSQYTERFGILTLQ